MKIIIRRKTIRRQEVSQASSMWEEAWWVKGFVKIKDLYSERMSSRWKPFNPWESFKWRCWFFQIIRTMSMELLIEKWTWSHISAMGKWLKIWTNIRTKKVIYFWAEENARPKIVIQHSWQKILKWIQYKGSKRSFLWMLELAIEFA